MDKLKLLLATMMGLAAQVTMAGSSAGSTGDPIGNTAERAQKEVTTLLSEVDATKVGATKLDTGLKEVQSGLRVLGIHIGTPPPR